MGMLEETERIHPILGPMRFDDGKDDPNFGNEESMPCWVARPLGWFTDEVEILLSGDSSGPESDSLNRAIQAFNLLEKIKHEGRERIRPMIMNGPPPDFDVDHYQAEISWIDCQQTKTTVVFYWAGYVYVGWEAVLDEMCNIIDFQQKLS